MNRTDDGDNKGSNKFDFCFYFGDLNYRLNMEVKEEEFNNTKDYFELL